MNNKIVSILILLILILGAFLRIHELGVENLRFDEVTNVDRATRGLSYLFIGDDTGPLYYFILRFWIMVFGTAEASLRMPSVLFSLGSLILLYKIAAKLFDKNVGLISMFLFSISPFHIFYSQDVSQYSLFVLLSLCSVWLFIKMSDKPTNLLMISFILSNILLLYTNILGIFIILIQNVFFFRKMFVSYKKWCFLQIIILFFFMFWIVPFLKFYVLGKTPFFLVRLKWIPRPSLNYLIETFNTFCYGADRFGGMDIFQITVNNFLKNCLAFLFASCFLFGVFSLKKNGEFNHISFLLLWLFFPILALLLISYLVSPFFIARYFIFSFPAFLIIASKGIVRLLNNYLVLVVLFLFFVLMLGPLHCYYNNDLKMRWEEAIQYIHSKLGANDAILVCTAKEVQMFGYYGKEGAKYAKDQNKWNEVFRTSYQMRKGEVVYYEGENKLIGFNDINDLGNIILSNYEDNKSFWFIMSRWCDRQYDVMRYLKLFCRVKEEKSYNGVNMYYLVISESPKALFKERVQKCL